MLKPIRSITRLSPAKINLFLHIVGRRTDGYHELQTAFQFLDYADVLKFKLNENGKIYRQDNAADFGEQDLILQAAKLLKTHTGSRYGATIHLGKKIPMGGGLGGGSSNAATTLVALNELWQSKVPLADLLKLGLKLGADVPIFIHGKAAWAEGIGEKIQYLDFKEQPTLVVCPQVSVSTTQVFALKELTRDTSRMKIRSVFNRQFKNDFATVVCQQYPEVAKVMAFLQRYGEPKLTGSGGCVFVNFAKMDEARKILDIIPPDWKAFVANSRNRSLLY